MENVVKISIVGGSEDSLIKTRDRVLKRHLVAAVSYNECTTTFWQGGQIVTRTNNIIRGITLYEKIPQIEDVLPDDVFIISACPSTYVNPKTERWLKESIE